VGEKISVRVGVIEL